MKLSVVVSSNRPAYWSRFCQHIAANQTELEVIIVGPCQDRPELPTPTRFITSHGQPVLCWAIGSHYATGDLICLAPDDLLYQPGFLDAVATRGISRYDMLSAHYWRNGVDFIKDHHFLSMASMPLLPICGFMRTDSYRAIGGLDRRFHGAVWDVDLSMRCHELGGRTTILDYRCHEDNLDQHNLLFSRYKDHDVAVLKSLWYRDGQPSIQRTSSIQPFTDEELCQN